ncbi:MAG TPA: carbohydrate-binding family 9-like protein [Thermoanaerobaculia bacterium]|nr:carbohydrate-binding family 9-like protein [Thermoanaerobaculia bacterium]
MTALPLLEVRRGEFSLEDLWLLEGAAPAAPLRDATNGLDAPLATSVAALYDTRRLYVLFSGQDDRVYKASYLQRDEPLYEEDVVEIFLAASDLRRYVEIEVSPKGTLFDARIYSPNGSRQGIEVDRAWDCSKLWTALRRSGTGSIVTFDTVVSIPFEGLGWGVPGPGAEWRANFYRVDRRPSGDNYSAWSPTMRKPADFHVPSAFGTIRFL